MDYFRSRHLKVLALYRHSLRQLHRVDDHYVINVVAPVIMQQYALDSRLTHYAKIRKAFSDG